MSRQSSRSFLAAFLCLPLVAAAAGLPPIFEADHTLAAPPPVDEPATATAPAAAGTGEADIDARLRKLERVMASGALVKMLMRLDALQAQVARLQGSSEEQNHALQTMTRRQRDLYSDIDRRLSRMEKDLKALKSTAPASSPASPAVATRQSAPQAGTGSERALNKPATAPVAVATGGAAAAAGSVTPAAAPAEQPVLSAEEALQESTAYESALALLRKRRYEEALKAFKAFLEKYPNGSYSANALYWVGEANYVTRRYEEAIAAFERVGRDFSDSPKVPAAMLKMAFSHYELKHWQKARELLEAVTTKFPQGSVARLAEKRLHRMKIEGH